MDEIKCLDVFPLFSTLLQKLWQQITEDIERITPEMLPLTEINQSDIDRSINQITGGLQNVQDIYGLSPLQDGIMFHHLLENQGDSYQVIFRLITF
ncbi:hypothetical protein [Photorhabdus stackebrandtii]|uniref:Uncharacterized protein n=1 Tax=Photorhabdus stackebrandtii TaxID=1123042 RepID=A0A7X5QPF0_9GAMM|nr:hypothetical protein [Photorhabdus stackebrandtii]NHB98126.1 hypothetical protein [Photorhabdus stackebrandtii]